MGYRNSNQIMIFTRFFNDFKKYWEYISFASKAELKTEVSGSFLGWIWWVLDPLLFMMVYTFVVSFVFESGGEDFPIFVFVGLTAWNFMNNTITSSVKIIVSFRSIISKVYLPKFVLILVRMYKNLIKLGISFILVFILMIFFNVEYSWKLIFLLPIVIVHSITTFAISVFVAHIGVFVADSVNIVNVILRFLFYVSGTLYSIAERIPEPFQTIMLHVNPIASIIQEYRNVIMYQSFPSLYYLFYWLVIGIILSLACLSLMYRYENTYVKVVQNG